MYYLTVVPFILLAIISCRPTSNFTESGTGPISHEQWSALLKKHVAPEGWVDYEGFIKDSAQLNAYLELLSNNPPNKKEWPEKEWMVYWINAYNAFTVKLIVDHYPVSSIRDIGPKMSIPLVNTVWHMDFFRIGGKDMDLDHIEHDILREEGDPRIHFAINCASVSCPKLRTEAYTAEELDRQLNDQASYFINKSGKNKIDKDSVVISKIFKWFTGDFKTKNTGLIDFLNRFSAVEISEDAEIDYMDYDWSLNEKP